MRWSLLPVPSTVLLLVLATGLLGPEYAVARSSIGPLPFFGLDHLLAILALGVWAGRLGGDATLVLPMAATLGVAVGLAMAMDGVGLLPAARALVWASVAALSLTAALPARLRLEEAGCLVGLFGFCHGQAAGGVSLP